MRLWLVIACVSLAAGGWVALRGTSESFVVVECGAAQGDCRVLHMVETSRLAFSLFGRFTMTTEVLAKGDLVELAAVTQLRFPELAAVDIEACLSKAAALQQRLTADIEEGNALRDALQCKVKVDV